MKPGWQSCSISPPARLPGSPRPPYPGSEQLHGAETREAEDRHPMALRLPPLAGAGWGRGRRAASRCSFPAPLPPPLWQQPLWPSEWGWGALRPPGGPPAAVPETRAGGGGRPRLQHRPPWPSGRSPLTSANFLVPLGGSERTRARAPGCPRPGWASRLLVGAPGHPPARCGPDGGALHCPPALRSKLMPRLNPPAITHDHHRGFYLSV